METDVETRVDTARMRLIAAREAQYKAWKDGGYQGRYINRVRPFVVEFCGTPKSGKTTMKEMLKHYFRRANWGVCAPEEGAEAVKWARDEPWYNFSTCEYALGQLRQEFYSGNDIIILDRALMDGMVRMEHYRKSGRMSEDEYKSATGYYDLPWNTFAFDLHVFLVAQPNVAISRELAGAMTDKQGQTMNPTSLSKLLTSHEETWQLKQGDTNQKLTWHDSSNEGPPETAAAIMDAVLTSFEARNMAEEMPEGTRLRY